MRHGWFRIPGVQNGDRTLEEQMLGLAPALAGCAGKTVLDLGSAEGLIAREFAKAGAASVLGIELVREHVAVARKMTKGLANVAFVEASLLPYIQARPEPEQYDLVLALGVAHKLHEPGVLLTFAARSARELVVFRGPGKNVMFWDGRLKSKHTDNTCHVPTLMAEHGFELGETLDSARGEKAQYWRRKAAPVDA